MFYGFMTAGALLFGAVFDFHDIFFAPEKVPFDPLLSVRLGFLCAVIFVILSYLMKEYFPALKNLERVFIIYFWGNNLFKIFLLAASSAIGEEFLFRGFFHHLLGPWGSALLFAFSHFVPMRGGGLWLVFVLGAGASFGFLTDYTGNLIAPIIAHFTINFVNILLMVRTAKKMKASEREALFHEEHEPQHPNDDL